MPKSYDPPRQDAQELRQKVLGFGKQSHQKSYYPALRRRIRELEQLRILLDHSADAMFWAEMPSGRLVDLNKTARTLLSLPSDGISDTDLTEIFSADAFKMIESAFQKMVGRTSSLGTSEITIKGQGGKQIPLEMTVGLHRMDDGVFAMVVARDISERKRAEKERLKLEKRLLHAQKMEAVGQLAGGVAHDFNNLLQIIRGYGDISLMNLPPDTPLADYIQKMMTTVERGAALVSQLLTFSRKEAYTPEIIDLNNVLADLTHMLFRTIGEHIELELLPADKAVPVYADMGQVGQIIINMCINARDAMPEGGKIILRTDTVCVNKPPDDEMTSGENYGVLAVSDNGIGISEEIQNRMFEPFFTTKEVGSGSGLGLSTAYAIVKRHKGWIECDSMPGRGTAFRIYFPLSGENAVKSSAENEVFPDAEKKEAAVLIAEDEAMVRELGVMILEDAGYEVLAAEDGNAALEVFHENSARIDLVILDVVMPKKNGRAVYEAIAPEAPHMPVLFSTGYSDDILDGDSFEGKPVRLISKPFSPRKLLRTVREMLE